MKQLSLIMRQLALVILGLQYISEAECLSCYSCMSPPSAKQWGLMKLFVKTPTFEPSSKCGAKFEDIPDVVSTDCTYKCITFMGREPGQHLVARGCLMDKLRPEIWKWTGLNPSDLFDICVNKQMMSTFGITGHLADLIPDSGELCICENDKCNNVKHLNLTIPPDALLSIEAITESVADPEKAKIVIDRGYRDDVQSTTAIPAPPTPATGAGMEDNVEAMSSRLGHIRQTSRKPENKTLSKALDVRRAPGIINQLLTTNILNVIKKLEVGQARHLYAIDHAVKREKLAEIKRLALSSTTGDANKKLRTFFDDMDGMSPTEQLTVLSDHLYRLNDSLSRDEWPGGE